MRKVRYLFILLSYLSAVSCICGPAFAWYDETHLAVAKAAGYKKWYNATAADLAKLKAGDIESDNHFSNNPRGTVVTPEMVLSQVVMYDKIDSKGHLYGAIIASIRHYFEMAKKEKYAEYHLSYCAHYVGDLSVPLHNTINNAFNKKYHLEIDATVNDDVLDNLDRIKTYPIIINSEHDLAKEIARIATLSIELGYRLEDEGRVLTKNEAYIQLGHSTSLFKAILQYVGTKKEQSYQKLLPDKPPTP